MRRAGTTLHRARGKGESKRCFYRSQVFDIFGQGGPEITEVRNRLPAPAGRRGTRRAAHHPKPHGSELGAARDSTHAQRASRAAPGAAECARLKPRQEPIADAPRRACAGARCPRVVAGGIVDRWTADDVRKARAVMAAALSVAGDLCNFGQSRSKSNQHSPGFDRL